MARVYVLSIPISENGNIDIPPKNLEVLHSLDYFLVERARTARRYIKTTNHPKPIAELNILEIDKNNPTSMIEEFIAVLQAGHSIGIMSESGNACVADPGSLYVARAHDLDFRVIPVSGPSSILLSLMASGMNGQDFHFHGYLPIKDGPLSKAIANLKLQIQKSQTTHIFIETPYRNQRMLDMLCKSMPNQIRLCIAIEITGEKENIKTKSIADWKEANVQLKKENTVFLLSR